jgi:hypothetical protein
MVVIICIKIDYTSFNLVVGGKILLDIMSD